MDGRKYLGRVLLAIFLTACLASCNGGGSGGGNNATEPNQGLTTSDFIIAKLTGVENVNNPISLVVMTKDASEVFGVLADKDSSGNPTNLRGAFYISELKDSIAINTDSDGLPESYIDSLGNKVVFQNYTDSSVDITVFDAQGKIIKGPTTVNINPSKLKELKELFSSISSEFSNTNATTEISTRLFNLHAPDLSAIRWASLVSNVALCAIGISVPGTQPLALSGCSSTALELWATVSDNENIDALTTIIDTSVCGKLLLDVAGGKADPIKDLQALADLSSCLDFIIEYAQSILPGPSPIPTLEPTPSPSPSPKPINTPTPKPFPTPFPLPTPMPIPTPIPTSIPTPEPSPQPTPIPTPIPSNSIWPMFQFDPQHTGHSTDTTSFIFLSSSPTWTYQVSGLITSSPSIVGDVAYFGSSDGKIHKFNSVTGVGNVLYSTDPSIWSAAAVSDTAIYISGSSTLGAGTFLYALNTSDGSEIWPPVLLGPSCDGASSPVVYDGVIYVGSGGAGTSPCSSDNWVYAISAETGNVLWKSPIVDPNESRKYVNSSPAVTEDTVVVGTWGSCNNCPTVFAFNRLTGALKWSAIVNAFTYPAPSIANGLVYVNSSESIIAFDEQTGDKVWETGIGNVYGQGSPSIADGIVYTGAGFSIHALDAITGQTIWTVPAESAGTCATSAFIRYPFFAIANGIIFIKSGNECNVAKVYLISGTTGELYWDTGDLGDNIAAGGEDTSTPAVANGKLYFGIGNTFYVYGE